MKPTLTDQAHRFGDDRYHTAEESRAPGYLARRFKEIAERARIDTAMKELREQERAERVRRFVRR